MKSKRLKRGLLECAGNPKPEALNLKPETRKPLLGWRMWAVSAPMSLGARGAGRFSRLDFGTFLLLALFGFISDPI